MLAPIWDEAADKINEKFKDRPGKVAVGKVDCDKEGEITIFLFNTRFDRDLSFCPSSVIF